MKSIKIYLILLLFITGLVTIFTTPGRSIFELYLNQTDAFAFYFKYSFVIQFVYDYILKYFPIDLSNMIFYRQIAWIIQKYVLYGFFLLTWLAIIFFQKNVIGIKKLSLLDSTLALFLCIPIIFSVSLTYFELLALPILITSFTFLFRGKILISSLLYFIVILISWPLVLFSPIYLWYARYKSTLLWSMLFGFIGVAIVFFIKFFDETFSSQISDLITRSTTFIFLPIITKNIFVSIPLTIGISIGLIILTKNIYIILTVALITLFGFPISATIFLFLYIYYRYVKKFTETQEVNLTHFLTTCFSLLMIFLIIFPIFPEGLLIFLPILSLLTYIVNSTDFFKYKLVFVNILVFSYYYMFFGISGQVPIRSLSFDYFRGIFWISFILFSVWIIKIYQNNNYNKNISKLKWLIIFLFVILLIGHIPSVGDPDVDNWAKYTNAVVKHVNPFYAHTQVVQLYAPFSTVVMGGFAQIWYYTIGPSKDYAIATKLGILFFLLWMIIFLLKKVKSVTKTKDLTLIDKLLVISTTFILINQPLGYGDINIYLIPFIFLSIWSLYKNKYFLCGIWMGLAVSIKWQPLILLPLFAVAIFDIRKNFIEICKNSILFLLGFIPVVVAFWAGLMIQPHGYRIFRTAYLLYTQGGVYLSGLALNAGWVATYFLPIIYPQDFSYWMGLGRMAQVIGTNEAPYILQGILFYIALFAICIKYWLIKNKNILRFTTACMAIFLSHYALNASAMDLHFFYQVVFMLFVYFLNPTIINRWLLILLDVMAMISNILFYGFTGEAIFNRLVFGFDITVLLAVLYMVIYFFVMGKYFRGEITKDE